MAGTDTSVIALEQGISAGPVREVGFQNASNGVSGRNVY